MPPIRSRRPSRKHSYFSESCIYSYLRQEWNKAEANKQFNDLISGTANYFSNYYPADSNRAQRAVGKLSALLTDVQGDMQRIAGKCSQTSRKRRDVAERWSVPINNPKTALNELFWVHARWAREEIYPGPKNCSKKALRIYKRLDRLKSISAWQYCDKVDNSEGFCSWAYFDVSFYLTIQNFSL